MRLLPQNQPCWEKDTGAGEGKRGERGVRGQEQKLRVLYSQRN